MSSRPSKAEVQVVTGNVQRQARANEKIQEVLSDSITDEAIKRSIEADMLRSEPVNNRIKAALIRLRASTGWAVLMSGRKMSDQDWETCRSDYHALSSDVNVLTSIMESALGRVGCSMNDFSGDST